MGLLIVPILMGVAVYFLPTFIGFRKQNGGAIFALNLLLGWTVLGWVAALVWAMTKDTVPNAIVLQPFNVPVPNTPTPPGWACTVCGTPMITGDAFCRNCGTKIAR